MLPENPTLHVKDLYSLREDRLKREYSAYKSMLDKIFRRIKNTEMRGGSDMIYDVPPFVIGMPLYNREYAVNYIMQSLQVGGFETYYLGESYIYINWGCRKIKTKNGEEIKDPNRFGIQRKVRIQEDVKRRPVRTPDMSRDSITQSHKTKKTNRERLKKEKKSELIRDQPNALGIKTADSLLRETIMNKPEFSIDALRKLQLQAASIGMGIR